MICRILNRLFTLPLAILGAFNKSETQEAVSRILKYAEDKEKGSFNPSRERDELSLGLGNKEHKAAPGG